MSEENKDFMKIPDELWCETFKFLDLSTYKTVVFVSKRFSKLCLVDYMMEHRCNLVFHKCFGEKRIQETFGKSDKSWSRTFSELQKITFKFRSGFFWHGSGDEQVMKIKFNTKRDCFDFQFSDKDYECGSGGENVITIFGVVEDWDRQNEKISLHSERKTVTDDYPNPEVGECDYDVRISIKITDREIAIPVFVLGMKRYDFRTNEERMLLLE